MAILFNPAVFSALFLLRASRPFPMWLLINFHENNYSLPRHVSNNSKVFFPQTGHAFKVCFHLSHIIFISVNTCAFLSWTFISHKHSPPTFICLPLFYSYHSPNFLLCSFLLCTHSSYSTRFLFELLTS